jgi:hypothetical protein
MAGCILEAKPKPEDGAKSALRESSGENSQSHRDVHLFIFHLQPLAAPITFFIQARTALANGGIDFVSESLHEASVCSNIDSSRHSTCAAASPVLTWPR